MWTSGDLQARSRMRVREGYYDKTPRIKRIVTNELSGFFAEDKPE